MKLIIGLGNPEREYKGTRHNAGFEVANKLSFDHSIPINKAKHRCHLGEGVIAGVRAMIAKPQTYMNLSGEAARDLLSWYRLEPEDIIVVYDDASLPLGSIRIRKQGGAGGHNGMKSIIYHLGTEEFIRVRVGIGEKPPNWVLADYVLSKFKKEEMESFIEGVAKAGDAVCAILRGGPDAAMNIFNKTLKDKEAEI
ncbi:MAG: aminoacyl-tRNA hydrolase [Clostridiales bacterium]|jgi:PTH1 family peptidyl-tRNA hydrolase|nr:aminoacyl-tRNA hydrolase [Clostridiales bacterium]